VETSFAYIDRISEQVVKVAFVVKIGPERLVVWPFVNVPECHRSHALIVAEGSDRCVSPTALTGSYPSWQARLSVMNARSDG
jgi:hypothetical protein